MTVTIYNINISKLQPDEDLFQFVMKFHKLQIKKIMKHILHTILTFDILLCIIRSLGSVSGHIFSIIYLKRLSGILIRIGGGVMAIASRRIQHQYFDCSEISSTSNIF